VGGGIFLAEIGFDFDNAGSDARAARVTHQHLAQHFAGDAAGRSGEERAVERAYAIGGQNRRDLYTALLADSFR